MTPIQRAIGLVLGSYAAAARTLTAAERDVLRDVIACRLAADWLEEQDAFGADDVERAA